MSAAASREPAGDHRGAVGTARAQALLEHCPRGRQYEYGDALGHALTHLPRALPVDLEQHAAAGRQLRADLFAAGAVIVIEYAGVLEERAVGDQALKFVNADKM